MGDFNIHVDIKDSTITKDKKLMMHLYGVVQCFTEIKKRMSENVLYLNSDKTEVMLIVSPHQLHKAESVTDSN